MKYWYMKIVMIIIIKTIQQLKYCTPYKIYLPEKQTLI